MDINKLEAFAGLPINWNGVQVHSPTITDILKIGEDAYYINLVLASFNKEKILLDLYKLDETKYKQIQDEDDYEVLTSHVAILEHISDSLAFFFKENVEFSVEDRSFNINGVTVITKDNYIEFMNVIRSINGLENEIKKKINFKNSKAKEIVNKMKELREKNNKNSDSHLTLKDVLSILCIAEGNGISIFNVCSLTIYQVYEQLERMNVKETFNRMLPVWANGNLAEGTKLPEWVKATKL